MKQIPFLNGGRHSRKYPGPEDGPGHPREKSGYRRRHRGRGLDTTGSNRWTRAGVRSQSRLWAAFRLKAELPTGPCRRACVGSRKGRGIPCRAPGSLFSRRCLKIIFGLFGLVSRRSPGARRLPMMIVVAGGRRAGRSGDCLAAPAAGGGCPCPGCSRSVWSAWGPHWAAVARRLH